MRPAVDRDDAGIMDLLIEDDDVAGGLDQPEIVVIASWRHGRSAVGSHNAGFPRSRPKPRRKWLSSVRLISAQLTRPIDGQVWNPAFGMTDDQRRTPDA